jgi:hypothetical protein
MSDPAVHYEQQFRDGLGTCGLQPALRVALFALASSWVKAATRHARADALKHRERDEADVGTG